MRSPIPKLIKKLVVSRANSRCEYCRLPEALANYDFHIDHIVGIQHGGSNSSTNLAYCCAFCNWKKGTNLATLIDNELVRIFNPRKQNWFEHFSVQEGVIVPKTKIGTATARLIEFNLIERIEIRKKLALAGFYP